MVNATITDVMPSGNSACAVDVVVSPPDGGNRLSCLRAADLALIEITDLGAYGIDRFAAATLRLVPTDGDRVAASHGARVVVCTRADAGCELTVTDRLSGWFTGALQGRSAALAPGRPILVYAAQDTASVAIIAQDLRSQRQATLIRYSDPVTTQDHEQRTGQLGSIIVTTPDAMYALTALIDISGSTDGVNRTLDTAYRIAVERMTWDAIAEALHDGGAQKQ